MRMTPSARSEVDASAPGDNEVRDAQPVELTVVAWVFVVGGFFIAHETVAEALTGHFSMHPGVVLVALGIGILFRLPMALRLARLVTWVCYGGLFFGVFLFAYEDPAAVWPGSEVIEPWVRIIVGVAFLGFAHDLRGWILGVLRRSVDLRSTAESRLPEWEYMTVPAAELMGPEHTSMIADRIETESAPWRTQHDSRSVHPIETNPVEVTLGSDGDVVAVLTGDGDGEGDRDGLMERVEDPTGSGETWSPNKVDDEVQRVTEGDSSDVVDQFNRLGQEGWEMISISWTGDHENRSALFKRHL